MNHNSLDDPPCPDGDDLGLGQSQPILEPKSDGMAFPSFIPMMAVQVPRPGVVVYARNHRGRPISRISLTEGDYHVMVSPLGGGMQFCLQADLFDPANQELQGACVPFNAEEDLSEDPRAILLQRFWHQLGYDATPFAIQRTGLVTVRGQFSMVRVGNRWFDGDNVHAQLGTCRIVEQGNHLRFLRPWEMNVEFSHIQRPDGSRISL